MSRLLLAIGIGALTHLAAADVSGRWVGTMETGGSRVVIFLTLNQHGTDVSGTMAAGIDAKPVPIDQPEVQGDRLTFAVRDNANRTLEFRLTLTDRLLSGESSVGDEVSKVSLTNADDRRGYSVMPGPNSPPVLLKSVEPQYTEAARAAKLQGTVVLQVEIEPNGRISGEHIKVVRSLGMGLDEKAIDAVKQWGFKPAYKNGRPVAARATIEVNFRLLKPPGAGGLGRLLRPHALRSSGFGTMEPSTCSMAVRSAEGVNGFCRNGNPSA